MIDGICGGIAAYFHLDSTLVRIAWLVLTLLGGSGIILYILAMIIMPSNPVTETPASKPQSSRSSQKFWGVLLVAIGTIWLLGNLGISFWNYWWGFSWELGLAVLLILVGVGFLFGGRSYVSQSADASQPASSSQDEGQPVSALEPVPSVQPKKLYRSRTERKLFGVCGGLGKYLNLDPTIVRLLFIVSAVASFGITLFVYLVMIIVVSEEPLAVQTA